MLRLITESTTPENPTIRIRWCIDPSDRAKLLELGAEQIHVLIITAYENGGEDRQLRPLGEALAYVGLRYPGKHTIFAMIVWPSETKDFKKLRNWILDRRSSTGYENILLNFDRDELKQWVPYGDDITQLQAAEPLQVEVDNGHFAKEPPRWLNGWVNEMYSSPPRDQCDFRRRMIWAFTAQIPLVILIWIFLWLVSLILYFAGALVLARGLSFRNVVKGECNEVWSQVRLPGDYRPGFSCWILEDEHRRPRLHRVLISPIFWLAVFGVLTYLKHRFKMGYLQIILFGVGYVKRFAIQHGTEVEYLAFAITGTVFAIYLFLMAKSRFESMRMQQDNSQEYHEQLQKEAEERRKKYWEESYQYLTCPTSTLAPTAAKLQALPPKRRTLRLYFHELKREVCRPYAR